MPDVTSSHVNCHLGEWWPVGAPAAALLVAAGARLASSWWQLVPDLLPLGGSWCPTPERLLATTQGSVNKDP